MKCIDILIPFMPKIYNKAGILPAIISCNTPTVFFQRENEIFQLCKSIIG